MILTLALLAAFSGSPEVKLPPPPAAGTPTTANGRPAPVLDPVWLNGPTPQLIQSCMDGYLKDKTFTGEPFIMACTVQKDGGLDGCLVQESKRAQAAGLHDVAVCAAAGFRMGPIDKSGKPTFGRPVKIPMGITPVANVAHAPPAHPKTPAPAPAASTPAKKP